MINFIKELDTKIKSKLIFILILITISILLIWMLVNIDRTTNETKIINSIQSIQSIVETNNQTIKSIEESNSRFIRQSNCLKQQLNRLIEWLEYSIEYCNDEANLLKFDHSNF